MPETATWIPRIFLSYTHSDEAYAQAIRNSLIAEGYDLTGPEEIPAGDVWIRSLLDGIARSNLLIAIVSDSSEANANFAIEVGAALSQPSDQEPRRVLPLIVGQHKPGLGILERFKYLDARARDPESVATRVVQELHRMQDLPAPSQELASPEERGYVWEAGRILDKLEEDDQAIDASGARIARVGTAIGLIAGLIAILATLLASSAKDHQFATVAIMAVANVTTAILASAAWQVISRIRRAK